MNTSSRSTNPTVLLDRLRNLGIIDKDENPVLEALDGGVSSDIWSVKARTGTFCVKRALPQLKTEKEWFVPVERNANEANWLRCAHNIVPEAVPGLLVQDEKEGMFVMEYLDPARFPVWKAMLQGGLVCSHTAGAVGDTLGTIHSATANSKSISHQFATDDIFEAIRIEPYLLRTVQTHPDLASDLERLASVTATTKRVLVHGDVSPKNILVGPDGPVFLDAECAWYGDPAFDVAFCLNHLLLKCIWRPQWTTAYVDALFAFAADYFKHVSWEQPTQLETRIAHLLPGLMLARIDGASPVEYITEQADKELVRDAARAALVEPCDKLAHLCHLFRSSCQL